MSDTPLRLLANENFPGPLIRELRRRGHDVSSVKESMRGATALESGIDWSGSFAVVTDERIRVRPLPS